MADTCYTDAVNKTKLGNPLKERMGKARRGVLAAFQDYCNISTLHGLRNIAAEGASWCERLSWFCIVTICTGLTVSMFWNGWQRYQGMPTMTTIESNHHPISKIPFPAVTVCNTNVILQSSALVIIAQFEAAGLSRNVAVQFLQELPQAFKANRPFQLVDRTRIATIMKKLNYTLSSLMFELSQPCARLFQKCSWKGDTHNCSDMFVHIATSEGYCCSFNWHGQVVQFQTGLHIRKPTNSSHRWKRSGKFNKKLFVSEAGTTTAGLTVVIDTEMHNYYSSINSFLGAAVLIHDPDRYPDVGTPRVYVQPQFETNIRVTATVVECSDNVRKLLVDQRMCRFQDEVPVRSGKYYTYESCVLDCRINAYIKKCGCVPFFYPKPESNTTQCDLNDWNCLKRNKDIFSSSDFDGSKAKHEEEDSAPCGCLPSCSDIDYGFQAFGNQIFSSIHASSDFDGNLGNRSSFSVFFQDNVCMKYRRVSQMNFEAILGGHILFTTTFGGILGLCLGGSVVSVIELIYYVTVKIWQKPSKNKKKLVLPYINKERLHVIAPNY